MNIQGHRFFGGLGAAFAVLLALTLIDASAFDREAQQANVIEATQGQVGDTTEEITKQKIEPPTRPEVGLQAPQSEETEEHVPPTPRETQATPDTSVSPTVTPADIGLSLGERAALISLHNDARAQKGVAPLTWSSDLAESVGAWVLNLKGRGCVLEHSGSDQFGENLYYGMKSNGQTTAGEVMSGFLDEEKYYDPVTNTCEGGEKCGHYTQIMWEDTTKLGCAKAVCISPGMREEVWGCQYGPKGNIIGQRPYTID
jgi:pathogenesis-related protein 1